MDPNSTSWVLKQGYLLLIAASLAAGSVAAAVMYRLYYLMNPKRKAASSWPPTPPGYPIFGHLHLLGAQPHMDMFKLGQKYGPLFHLRMGCTDALVVCSAAMAKEVLKIHDRAFASRTNGACVEIFSHNFQDVAGAPYGAHWRSMRKICLLELFTPKRLESFQYMRNEETSSLVQNMLEESHSGNAVTMSLKLTQLTLNVVTRMAMGKSVIRWGCGADVAAESKKFRDIIQEIFVLSGIVNNLGDYFPSLRRFDLQGYEKRMRAAVRRFDDVAYQMIDEHRKEKRELAQSTDLLDVLLSLPAGEDGKLSDVKVVAVMLDILTAGVDTSSSTIEWALTELIKESEKMKRVQEEIESVVGTERKVEESDLPNFPYLYAIVKETLRLHPPAPLLLPHESIEACKLQGYNIPAKTRLYVNVFAIGRDPTVWDRALDFLPERFLESQIDCRGQNFELLPFGSGRRICPGMSLGLSMVQLTLSRLLHSFDFELPAWQKREDIDMNETFGLTCYKTEPLQLVPKPRLSTCKLY
ncbi:protein MpCYP824A1 [Marchantia polymorpha subsp. ruderalis]|uniref:Cytochrome P450 n=2 Tax=Marchantia polymorpha TaxID=3197 RepID=A0A176W3P6_MARPO|nr:hypothetical protein AXG93_2520s1350 [Marchantia polymorpha subsp. ruderalis]PTQ32914.1 hypothetical protein MARPO_0093s0001 [Marchantia polymorpha]BBN11308.1 hypothetical protein Mp_5g10800 [Marchantia polymorpha subsp. ruderalis]|eukprot:PTQ32914.1 hypothetical protein MARPO_0093s0001 [Marchantia polymorpha]